ncbi:MAG: hypothetical protein HYY13_02620 [Nitrospirae bacterium]|nr:hypothetical protein [Nitrospirota bacterium]
MLESQAATEHLLKLYRAVRTRSRRLSALIHETRAHRGDPARRKRPSRRTRGSDSTPRAEDLRDLENFLLEQIIEIEHAYLEMRDDMRDPLLRAEMGEPLWGEASHLVEEILSDLGHIKGAFHTHIS